MFSGAAKSGALKKAKFDGPVTLYYYIKRVMAIRK
jgi:hypothetical protein